MASIRRPPPSYHYERDQDLWRIVAPYVYQRDLYSACLVSQLFHYIFSPYLWANPACRFGSDCDGVYLALTRFKRLLKRARLDVRRLTHTLNIPPAQPELYDGPQEGWLRDILDRLPSLQALIVSNLSFFDHQSLQAVHRASGTPLESHTHYVLRLLIASYCENTTAPSLAAALTHFPGLIYLDLSSTRGARHPSVLRQISSLAHLRVLKIHHCGLRDDDMDFFAFGSSSRIRSLDVSYNFLTEKGINNLLEGLPVASLPFRWCENTLWKDYSSLSIRCQSVVDSPIIGPRDGLENFIVSGLTSGFDGHLFIEDGLPATFSHLYLAGNNLTIGGLSKLLKYPRLQFLDCGSLDCYEKPVELLSPGLPWTRRASGFKMLSPHLFTQAFRNVTSLRLHHSVITEYPFSNGVVSPTEGIFELPSEDLRYELDSTELDASGMPHELDNTSYLAELPSDIPRFELPADSPSATQKPLCMVKSGTNGTSKSQHSQNGLATESTSSVEEGDSTGLLTPESATGTQSRGPKVTVSDGFPTPDQLGHSHQLPAKITRKQVSQPLPSLRPGSAPPGPETYPYTYAVREDPWHNARKRGARTLNSEEIISEIVRRRSRIETCERHPGRLKPTMLPSLETLILMDVPSMSRKRRVVEALSLFMQECAEEEELAMLEAEAEAQQGNQLRKPNRKIKLKRLVLEVSSCSLDFLEPPASPRSPGKKRESFTKSSTEDPDSEMFMEASEMDFTFFGEDDNSLLVSEGRIDSPRVVDDGMIFREPLASSPVDLEHPSDVIAELSAFRRDRRAKHENAVDTGRDRVEIALLGHWRGEVKVIRLQ